MKRPDIAGLPLQKAVSSAWYARLVGRRLSLFILSTLAPECGAAVREKMGRGPFTFDARNP